MTPLYDAVGRGIDSLDARQAKSGSDKAVQVIVTDGMENAPHSTGARRPAAGRGHAEGAPRDGW
jgi:hypothetical protein